MMGILRQNDFVFNAIPGTSVADPDPGSGDFLSGFRIFLTMIKTTGKTAPETIRSMKKVISHSTVHVGSEIRDEKCLEPDQGRENGRNRIWN
jgi:hypothetical protein